MAHKFVIALNTQFPNPSGNGGDETHYGAGLTPSRQILFSPIPRRPEIPTTYPPKETQSFFSGLGVSPTVPEPAPVSTMDLFAPQVSPFLSSFRDSPVPAPAPVASFIAGLPPLPPRRDYSVRGSGGGQRPRKTHRRTNSVIMSELTAKSLLAEISPNTVGENESDWDTTMNYPWYLTADEINASISSGSGGNNPTSGVKRRGRKETVPGYANDRLTESELEQIVADDRLVELAQKNSKIVKRILSNRRSAARSKDKKVKYMADLEKQVDDLKKQVGELKIESYRASVRVRYLERENMEMDMMNKELGARLQETEEETARLRGNGVMAINLIIQQPGTDGTITAPRALQDE
ncbi:unnamed protein product [Microthlaspi erraticum]|uniref:BZIP domain-containing protein n=1 Tax=Microthlaspi erraticum TaxID=1685480 RepID=A0A6D2K546_9BRAS|nr:unnamed protein product [Microthlaspi erraticum]